MRQMCILEKLNLKIYRGSMPPDPPTVLAFSARHPILNHFSLTNSELLDILTSIDILLI